MNAPRCSSPAFGGYSGSPKLKLWGADHTAEKEETPMRYLVIVVLLSVALAAGASQVMEAPTGFDNKSKA